MGKGGCRRQPTPTIDMEHLEDLLKDHVKKVGHSHAFQFGKYLSMGKTQKEKWKGESGKGEGNEKGGESGKGGGKGKGEESGKG